MVKIKLYNRKILPVVSYGRETCSFKLGWGGGAGRHKLRGFRKNIVEVDI